MNGQSKGVNLKKENYIEQPSTVNTAEIYPGQSVQPSVMPYPSPLANVPNNTQQPVSAQTMAENNLKFCKFCGARIHMDAVICTHCGRQVEQLQGAFPMQQPSVVINNNANNNINTTTAVGGVALGYKRSKWVCLCLLLFLGYLGVHKYYDGKIGMGILYMFTGGLLGIGLLIDFFVILTRPNPYYIS